MDVVIKRLLLALVRAVTVTRRLQPVEEIVKAQCMDTVNWVQDESIEMYKSEMFLNSFRSSNDKENNYRKILSVSVTRQNQTQGDKGSSVWENVTINRAEENSKYKLC